MHPLVEIQRKRKKEGKDLAKHLESETKAEEKDAEKEKGKKGGEGKKERKGKGKEKKGKGKRFGRTVCRICHQEGHWGNECPNRHSVRTLKPMNRPRYNLTLLTLRLHLILCTRLTFLLNKNNF